MIVNQHGTLSLHDILTREPSHSVSDQRVAIARLIGVCEGLIIEKSLGPLVEVVLLEAVHQTLLAHAMPSNPRLLEALQARRS